LASTNQKITIGEFGSSPYTSVTWGTPADALSSAMWFYASLAEWQGTDKFVIQALEIGGNWQGNARVGTISGSTFSMGTQITWTSAGASYLPSHQDMVYDTNIGDQMLVAYVVHDSQATNIATQILTLSGTDVTSTTPQSVSTTTGGTDIIGLAWDTDLKQALLIYGVIPEDSSGVATSYVVVISTSSGSSTVNTPINFASAAGNQYAGRYRKGVVYDSSKKRFALTYLTSTLAQQMTEITVSGTTPSFSGTNTAVGAQAGLESVGSALDTNSGKMVVVCSDVDSSNYLRSWVYTISGTSSNLTAQAFVGVADSAISASAAGSIIVQGGTVTGVASGSGLSAGSLVAFETSGSPSALSGVAFDANAGKMVIAYTYGTNGYAIVGTVSGTSASYGTAVIFQASAAIYSVNAAYDANAQKVVIIYTDGSNSDYPTAIVGTVSGTSISFGTKVAFLSSGAAGDPMSIAYDANAQKVVIGFRDTSNSNYGTGIVGTVSGTSISFGTKTAFNSSATLEFTTVYDSDAQKVAIGYRDAGNSSYGTAVVGTVSGTSISFGSPQVFLSAQTDNMGGCFDSTNNKVVFCYRDTGNSNYGTAIVGDDKRN
jgi:hypothetical protein